MHVAKRVPIVTFSKGRYHQLLSPVWWSVMRWWWLQYSPQVPLLTLAWVATVPGVTLPLLQVSFFFIFLPPTHHTALLVRPGPLFAIAAFCTCNLSGEWRHVICGCDEGEAGYRHPSTWWSTSQHHGWARVHYCTVWTHSYFLLISTNLPMQCRDCRATVVTINRLTRECS